MSEPKKDHRINIPVNSVTLEVARKAATRQQRPLSQWARLVILRELDKQGFIRLAG